MKQPCSECKQLPKAPGRHRCEECALRHRPMLEQIEAMVDRLNQSDPLTRRSRVPPREWPLGRRWCSGCQAFRMLAFGPGYASDFGPGQSRCRPCVASKTHESRQLKTYGLTPEDYDHLLKFQKGVCFICKRRPTKHRLRTDHNHKTGEVRGLLCRRCNQEVLGGADDSIEVLINAIEYLKMPPAAELRQRRLEQQEQS